MLAGLFALFWLLPSFGLIDLTVTWSSTWPQVLEAGWGLYFTLLVGAPFIAVAARSRLPTGAPEMLVVATLALLVSGVVALEIGCVVLGLILAVGAVAVTWPWRWSFGELRRSGTDRMSAVFGILAVASAGPWLVYAVHMWSLNRQDRFDSDVTNDVDHYSVQGAFGLAMVLAGVPARAGRDARGTAAGRSLRGTRSGIPRSRQPGLAPHAGQLRSGVERAVHGLGTRPGRAALPARRE